MFTSPLPRTRHMTHPSHFSSFGHPKNIRGAVQTTRLLITPHDPHSPVA
jgi:hypothetical protein